MNQKKRVTIQHFRKLTAEPRTGATRSARRKVMVVTIFAATLLAGAIWIHAVHALGSKAKDRVAKAAAPEVKFFSLPDARPKPTWKGWLVEVRRDVKATERESHLALVKVLSRMDFVPANRAAHFPFLADPDFRLDGWHAFMESSTPTPGGNLVTLRVTPRVNYARTASVTFFEYVLERFEVTDGAVRYVDSSEPPIDYPRGIIIGD